MASTVHIDSAETDSVLQVIKNAKGIAIFTTMRTGLWLSGSGGAGVLVAKLPDGSWSPPSGLMLHTVGLGFLAGIDIYDCVMVMNTEEALLGFSKLRGTVGGEISAVAGPIGMGAVLDSELHARRAPIFTYLKSRGLYAGVQMDGTVLIERSDENERFYGQKLPVMDILQGKVRHPPHEIDTLLNTLRAAQGDEVDWGVAPEQPPPSDYEIDHGQVFSVPDKMDPDPYGVLALEKEGLSLKEAGTNKRASHEAFTFNPAPSSPVFQTFNRNSLDGRSISRRNSWRSSVGTRTSVHAVPPRYDPSLWRPTSAMVDTAVQTDFEHDTTTPLQSPASLDSKGEKKMGMADIAEDESPYPKSPVLNAVNGNGVHTPLRQSEENTPVMDRRKSLSTPDSDDDEEPVVVQTVQTATTPSFMSRARVVSVKKANAPALPPRNPVRAHGHGLSIGSVNGSRTPERTSQDEAAPRSSSSVERTTSHDSTALVDVDLADKKDSVVEVQTPGVGEKDEFHSVANSPAQSPKLAPVTVVEGDKAIPQTAQV